MRNLGRGVIVGVVLATACGGGAKNADTTSSAAPPAGQPAAGSSASWNVSFTPSPISFSKTIRRSFRR